MHERGMADDELIDDHERDRFADATRDEPAPMGDDHASAVRDDRPMHEPTGEYAQGREDEAAMREGRFDARRRDGSHRGAGAPRRSSGAQRPSASSAVASSAAQRRADVEALGELAAQHLQVVELLARLDALGDHLEPEVVREADERLDDLERARRRGPCPITSARVRS